MSEYNIQMNKYNALNAEYDQLYPQPMKHASTHAKDGDDPITPSSIGASELGVDGKVLTSQLPSMEVDAYTKVQTLFDTTKSLFGLDANAVPDDVLSLIKTLIDNANASISTKVKIQTGSYVETGTYGASNPCSLTFDFEPEFVFVFRYNSAIAPFYAHNASTSTRTDCMIWLNKSSCEMNESSINIISFDESTNTLSWYIERPENYVEALMQLNLSSETFKYIVVG